MTEPVSPVVHLSALLEYPDSAFLPALSAWRKALPATDQAAAAELERFARAVEGMPVERLQEHYVETFDLNPRCTLDIGWHLFGEAYERGAFLATLRAELTRAGIAEQNELPDHLPTLLTLIDRADHTQAVELRRLIQPGLESLEAGLNACGSPYLHLVRSIVAAAGTGG